MCSSFVLKGIVESIGMLANCVLALGQHKLCDKEINFVLRVRPIIYFFNSFTSIGKIIVPTRTNHFIYFNFFFSVLIINIDQLTIDCSSIKKYPQHINCVLFDKTCVCCRWTGRLAFIQIHLSNSISLLLMCTVFNHCSNRTRNRNICILLSVITPGNWLFGSA